MTTTESDLHEQCQTALESAGYARRTTDNEQRCHDGKWFKAAGALSMSLTDLLVLDNNTGRYIEIVLSGKL